MLYHNSSYRSSLNSQVVKLNSPQSQCNYFWPLLKKEILLKKKKKKTFCMNKEENHYSGNRMCLTEYDLGTSELILEGKWTHTIFSF